MGRRIRHCVECPKCRTRYVIGSSPYRNGAHLVTRLDGRVEEHTLYCSCGWRVFVMRWSELKTYVVSNEAHSRGYGPPNEIVLVPDERPVHQDLSRFT